MVDRFEELGMASPTLRAHDVGNLASFLNAPARPKRVTEERPRMRQESIQEREAALNRKFPPSRKSELIAFAIDSPVSANG
jgi:hypothetical protein